MESVEWGETPSERQQTPNATAAAFFQEHACDAVTEEVTEEVTDVPAQCSDEVFPPQPWYLQPSTGTWLLPSVKKTETCTQTITELQSEKFSPPEVETNFPVFVGEVSESNLDVAEIASPAPKVVAPTCASPIQLRGRGGA